MTPRQILVVDDEPRLRTLIADVLEEAGHSVTAAATAEQAATFYGAAEAGGRPFEILFVDLHLPGTGGMELLRELKGRNPRLAAVILTAYADVPAAQEAIRLQVVELLTKPFDLGAVERALQACITRLAYIPSPAYSGAHSGAHPAARPAPQPPPPDFGAPQTLQAIELAAIDEALRRHNGNQSAAAAELGISRRTLYNKLHGR